MSNSENKNSNDNQMGNANKITGPLEKWDVWPGFLSDKLAVINDD